MTTKQAGIGCRCEYGMGAAERLPFADATFDLVTCQTVLMHIADVAVALTEMVRVLAPGGLLLAAEPNNLAGTLVLDSITSTDPIADARARRVHADLRTRQAGTRRRQQLSR